MPEDSRASCRSNIIGLVEIKPETKTLRNDEGLLNQFTVSPRFNSFYKVLKSCPMPDYIFEQQLREGGRQLAGHHATINGFE